MKYYSVLIEETVKSPIIYAYPRIDVETLLTWEASTPIGKLLLQWLYMMIASREAWNSE